MQKTCMMENITHRTNVLLEGREKTVLGQVLHRGGALRPGLVAVARSGRHRRPTQGDPGAANPLPEGGAREPNCRLESLGRARAFS